ncbi:hypothetical protein P3T22_003633 [Paraburkholderia sp. GAS348]
MMPTPYPIGAPPRNRHATGRISRPRSTPLPARLLLSSRRAPVEPPDEMAHARSGTLTAKGQRPRFCAGGLGFPEDRPAATIDHTSVCSATFCCSCPRARNSGHVWPRAQIARRVPRRHAGRQSGDASARTTNVVTIDAWLEILRRPLTSKAQRLHPISINVVTLASTSTTKGVTRRAVSTKVVAQ